MHYFARLVKEDADDNANQFEFINIVVVMLYSLPHEDLLQNSHGVLISCTKLGEDSLMIVDIFSILSIVAMIPHHI